MLLLEVSPHTSHCSNMNRMEWEGLLCPMHFKLHCLFLPINRCRSGCKKKRSLHTNSFFAEFSCVLLGTLLLAIYHFVSEDSWRQTVQRLNLKPDMVSKIYQWLRMCVQEIWMRGRLHHLEDQEPPLSVMRASSITRLR